MAIRRRTLRMYHNEIWTFPVTIGSMCGIKFSAINIFMTFSSAKW